MTWGVYAELTPPLLLAGDLLQFATREILAGLIEPEISQQRLLCINVVALPQNVERVFKCRVQGVQGEVALKVRGVFTQSDVMGLQVQSDHAVIVALKALAGPQALAAARRAVALRTEPLPPMNGTGPLPRVARGVGQQLHLELGEPGVDVERWVRLDVDAAVDELGRGP